MHNCLTIIGIYAYIEKDLNVSKNNLYNIVPTSVRSSAATRSFIATKLQFAEVQKCQRQTFCLQDVSYS